MSSNTVFEGVLRKPKLLSDIASLLASVDKTIHLTIDDSTVRIQTARQEYEVWARLNNESIFQSSTLTRPVQVTMSGDSLHKALSSDNGSRSVHLLIESKTIDTMMLTIKLNASASSELTVRQKIYANILDETQLSQEPDVGDLATIYVKLRKSQLEHLARVSDQYRHLASNIMIELKRGDFHVDTTEMSINISQPGLEIITTLDATTVSLASSQAGSSQPEIGTSQVTLRSADWCSVLQIRKLVNEVVIGVSDEQVVAVYANVDGLGDDTTTFYLYQQLP